MRLPDWGRGRRLPGGPARDAECFGLGGGADGSPETPRVALTAGASMAGGSYAWLKKKLEKPASPQMGRKRGRWEWALRRPDALSRARKCVWEEP